MKGYKKHVGTYTQSLFLCHYIQLYFWILVQLCALKLYSFLPVGECEYHGIPQYTFMQTEKSTSEQAENLCCK